MKYLSRDAAFGKLQSMVKGAEKVRGGNRLSSRPQLGGLRSAMARAILAVAGRSTVVPRGASCSAMDALLGII